MISYLGMFLDFNFCLSPKPSYNLPHLFSLCSQLFFSKANLRGFPVETALIFPNVKSPNNPQEETPELGFHLQHPFIHPLPTWTCGTTFS